MVEKYYFLVSICRYSPCKAEERTGKGLNVVVGGQRVKCYRVKCYSIG